ncbi:MAG: DNA cytosine methyltransferase [Chitinophagales bacterium]|nr:DNA cytosine methyltransferase [Chitinophagales bacterium]
MIKLFELFAGYGSQSLALKRLGVEFENVGYCEIDKYAIQAHKALHGEDIPNFGDITKVDAESLPDMDFLTYSFPCQDISVAGKGMGLSKDSGTRSSLLWECHKIIAAKRPKYLMMENVKNLVGKRNLPDFQSWINELRELGYNNYYKVVNAKDCGVPQNRERVFCVSIRRDADEGTFRFNEPLDNGVRLKDLLEGEVEEKFYIADEKVEKLITQLKEKNQEISYCVDANYYKGTTPEQFLEKSRRQLVAVPCLTPDRIEKRQNGRRFKEDGEPMFTLTGQDRPHIICEQRSDEGLRFFKNNICGTLRTIDACGDKRVLEVSNNYRIRKLTPRECFRLMGLADEEIKKIQDAGISNSQQYKMAGNSIVVDQMFFLKNLF